MKVNYSIVLALAFGTLANAVANKPMITSPSPFLAIVTIPCNTTTICHECPKSSAPPFSNTSAPGTPTAAPPGTAPGTITVPCIKCAESTASQVAPPSTITTTTFVTVPCTAEAVSVPSQPVAPPNTAPPVVVPGSPVPSGPLVPSKAVPTPGGEVPGASTPAVPSPPSPSRPGVPPSPPSPAPSPSGPARPPTFTGAGSVLSVNPGGTMMAIIIAALAIF